MALTGRAALLCLLGLVPVVVRPTAATAWWWLLGVLVLVVVDLVAAPRIDTLALRREPSRQVRLGEETETALLVRNVGRRRLRGVLRDAWQPSAGAVGERHTLSLPAGEQIVLRTRLVPVRRGDRTSDRVTVRSSGPLGLAARQSAVTVPGTVRCVPAFPSRRHLPSRLSRWRQIDGRSAVRVRGQGTEFDSLRDYVDGDDVRSIDWRATARRTHLVVRTWQPERDRRIVMLLDTSRTSAGRVAGVPRLDGEMDAAMLLAALAGRAGDRVQLLAGDRDVHTRVSGITDRAELMHQLTVALARVEPALVEADWRRLAAAAAAASRQRALLVLLTPLEPAAVEEGLLPLLPALSGRHRVVVASVSDPAVQAATTSRGDAAQVYDAAAAERTLMLRERTRAALERLGVTVLDAPPDRLPARLADHYLHLKRQGLL